MAKEKIEPELVEHSGLGRVKLDFSPSNQSFKVPPGVSVFDAASWNGIAIDSTCGGHGTCKKCKVQIIEGVVPISRLEAESGFNMGRSAEITRDEVKFYKFVERLRLRFASMLVDMLKTQVILKGIMTEDEWSKIQHDITFKFNKDSYFNELKENDIMRDRMDMLNNLTPYVGRYYSDEYIRKSILKQTDEEIIEINAQIANEQQEAMIKQVEMMQQQMSLGIQPEQQDGGQPPPQQ